MWNTKQKGSQESGVRSQKTAARRLLRDGLVSRRYVFCLLLSSFCLLSFGCRMDMQDQPRYEPYEPSQFFADGQGSRPLVEGTVARGHLREDVYFYTGRMEGAAGPAVRGETLVGAAGGVGAPNMPAGSPGGGDVNVRGNVAGGVPGAAQASATSGPDRFPIPVTREALERGRERFNAFCALCHGMAGEGDGMIVRRGFRRPPSFYEDRLQEGASSASHFFDVITNGWGAMPSYNEMIPAEDRWKIIAYVRALQLTRRLKADELSPEERERVAGGAGQPAGAPGGTPGTQQRPQTGGERH